MDDMKRLVENLCDISLWGQTEFKKWWELGGKLSQPQNRPQHPPISHTPPTSIHHVEDWPEDSASEDKKGAALEELRHAFEVECELRE